MRGGEYITRPSVIVQERIEEIVRQQIRFAIDPLGPSKFRVKPTESRNRKESYIVSIGSQQQCSCKEPELCSHILYIMMRYFGVPKDVDMLWQRYLTDHEIDQILDGRVRRRAEPPKKQQTYQTKSGKAKVKRLPIGEEDVCPICYDDLQGCEKAKIAWCRRGCGGNFHRKCVKAWIDSRRCHGEEPTCPMCREPLDMLGVNAPPKKPPVDAPPPLTQEEIRDLMTRELSPDDYHLLLRLDQAAAPAQRAPPRVIRRPKVNNQRTRAAGQIIANSPALEVTAVASAHSERQHGVQQMRRVNPPAPQPARRRVNPEFVGERALTEITGIRMCESDRERNESTSNLGVHREMDRVKSPVLAQPWRGGGGGDVARNAKRSVIPPKRHIHPVHHTHDTSGGHDIDLFVAPSGM